MTNQKTSQLLIAALTIQLSYIGMSVMWNLIGVGLMSIGQPPLGNSASMAIVVIMLVLALTLVLTVNRVRWLYATATGVLALGCLMALYTAFTGAAELWPSNYFRIFGALINVSGLAGFGVACNLIISQSKPS
ncbi:hypothetical protein N9842_01450 [Porticoccaceae bacterium]|nr:hypothetical protein [Porticoccaceae bacterium]MDB4262849.1 hypothetical protein [Porticoccaceae bacterium]